MNPPLAAFGLLIFAAMLAGILLCDRLKESWRTRVAVPVLLASPLFLCLGVTEELSHRCTEVAANEWVIRVSWLGSAAALGVGSGVAGRMFSRVLLISILAATLVAIVGVAAMTFTIVLSLLGDCAVLPERYRH